MDRPRITSPAEPAINGSRECERADCRHCDGDRSLTLAAGFFSARRGPICGIGAAILAVAAVWSVGADSPNRELRADESAREETLDPAAWGSDHVGKPLPNFVTGDECLFCHREVGSSWQDNRHQLTTRPVFSQPAAVETLNSDPELKSLADEVRLLLGHTRRVRYLKRGEGYGQLDMLSVQLDPAAADGEPGLIDTAEPHWNAEKFGKRCAGCHATGVNAKTHAFSLLSIDCFACHGDVDLEHTNDQSLILLSQANETPARVIASICGQCHIRDGRSQSTGLPYPNHFVPGDNLFRDFRVDWSDEHLDSLNPGDRHVLENIRDIVRDGNEKITCLSCHKVHEQSSRRHRLAGNRKLCLNCHVADGPKSKIIDYEVHSKLCEY